MEAVTMDQDMDETQGDICRVCRTEGAPDRPLYHPCVCTGSIKFIHQDCLTVWLKYSKRDFCEVCNHYFTFMPIYSPDMPKTLPVKDIFKGILKHAIKAIRFWFHYTLVGIAWLGVVPLTACRIYRSLFTGSVSSVLTLPLDMLSTENLALDILHGFVVVTFSLCVFIGLVWLREQILHGQEGVPVAPPPPPPNPIQAQPPGLEDNEAMQPAVPPPPEVHEDNIQQVNAGQGMQAPAEDEGRVRDIQVQRHVQAPQRRLVQGQGQGEMGVMEDNNWNFMAWDHAAEELTWERLLGLDGSLVFLEHVFWVVSLNTFFILVFAFCPYHVGHFTLVGFRFDHLARLTHFEGLVTTLCGYIVIGLCTVLLKAFAGVFHFDRGQKMLGLTYVVMKVSLLCMAEVGLFPLLCGWWIDLCSLPLLDATLKWRMEQFQMAPFTVMFFHWMAGIVFVFYMASFILVLREVLRPGVLWFVRNLNDPDFNPIQEMIHLSVLSHVRRYMASIVIFGTIIFFLFWCPSQIIKSICPSFLPYAVNPQSNDWVSVSGDSLLELMFLQVILPALLEQSHIRSWSRSLVRMWATCLAWILGIHSYLLGDPTNANPTRQHPQGRRPGRAGRQNNVVVEGEGHGEGVIEVHQEGVVYFRPSCFPLRVVILVVLTFCSFTLASLFLMTVPVMLGRQVAQPWFGGSRIHELFTFFIGLYLCWLAVHGFSFLHTWFPLGWNEFSSKLKHTTLIGLKCLGASSLLLGVIPYLYGLLLELVLVVPLRVSLHQTPIFSFWGMWAMGILYTKISIAVTMMCPNWRMKTVLEQVYQDGIWNLNLGLIVWDLAVPVIAGQGLALAAPYALARSIIPCFVTNVSLLHAISRRIYPFTLSMILSILVISHQFKQFSRLVEHIKNERYLVGRRLVNYDPHSGPRQRAVSAL